MAVNEEQLFTEWLEQSGFGKSPESKKTADAVERVVRDVGKATRGVGEGLLSMGTSFGGMPIVGLSGMAESGFGINPQRGVDWMQKISPHFAYQPHTEEGRIAAEKMAVPFEMLDRLFQWPSNKVVQGARKALYKKAGEVFRDIDNHDRYEISNANDDRGGNRAVPTLRELQEMASVQELSDVINNYLEAVSAQRSLLMGPVYWKLLGDELRSLGRFWGSDIPDRNQLLVLNSQPRAYSTGLLGRRK